MNSKKKKKAKTTTPNSTPQQSKGGISIKSGGNTKIGGHVVNGDLTETNVHPQSERAGTANPAYPKTNVPSVQSAWANGSFYLFVFVVVVGLISWLAGKLEPKLLGIVIVAGILAVPLIGAFQLRMDKRLSQKSFLDLVKLTIDQLPVIGDLTKRKS